MTFGGQARTGAAGVGARGARFFGLVAAVCTLFALLLTAGCGGGGGSSSPSDNGGGPTGGASDGFVNGRIVDAASGQPVAGAVVQYGNVAAVTTAADGNFSIRVGAPNNGNNLRVTGSGALSLYDYATINSQAYRIRTQGAPIPAMTAQQTYQVGSIQVFSTSNPPPPPIF